MDDQEEGEEMGLGNNNKKLMWVAVLLIAGTIWFLFDGKWGVQVFDTAKFDAVMLVLVVALLESGLTWLKNKTPKIIVDGNPSHFTLYINDFKQVGRWGVVRLGGIMATGIHSTGREATLVAPFNHFKPLGNCLVCTAKVDVINPERLPAGIRKYITDYKLPLPVIFGVFSSSQLKDPENARIQEELEQSNKTITVHEKTGKRIMELNEDVLEITKRMTGKDSVTEALKKIVFNKKDKDSDE